MDYSKEELNTEDAKKLINNAPEMCLITGMYKCESYTIGNDVVYLPSPAYDAYTYPMYDEDEEAFSHTKYDMDNDFMEENMHLCDLEDLENHPRLEEIKKYYNIQ